VSAACLKEDIVLDLLDGRLAPEEQAALHQHIGTCEACLRLVAISADPSRGASTPPTGALNASLPLAADDARIDRYEVLGPIGAGGMGVVYSAWDPALGRPVALKLLRPGADAQGDGRGRILREAQAMARLKHPNVVAVYDVGTWGGQVFIAMELVEGATLRRWLDAREREWREVVDVFVRAGRGLAAAHAAGLVHRDFKPDNALVGGPLRPGAKEGTADIVAERVLVTDFGVARLSEGEVEPAARPHGSSPVASTETPLGALLGTPGYMAPEQMRGARADARSDLFAFCTALYEAVAGTRPYAGKDLSAMRERAEAGRLEPPSKPMPRWLRRELERGLRPDPVHRHSSMDALLSALERGSGRRRSRLLLGGALLALAAALALLFARSGKPAPLRSIAILEPRPVQQQKSSLTLSGVLVELLSAELSGAELKRVPAGMVLPVQEELGLRGGPSLAEEPVRKLQQRLGVDLVLGGSFQEESGQVRVQLSLFGQGAARLLSVEDQGPRREVAQLAARLSARVRRELGVRRPESAERVAGSVPSDPEAARLYQQGIEELSSKGVPAAAASFRKALELSPGNPRIGHALAGSLITMGAEEQAREEAARAWLRRDELSPEERVLLGLLRFRTLRDSKSALALAREHYREQPSDPDRGLLLLRELVQGSEYKEALALAVALRKQPPPWGDDFRIDAHASAAAMAVGDLPEALAAARRFYASAEKRGSRHDMAVARMREGSALRRSGTDPALARKLLEESEALYLADHDELGSNGPRVVLALLLSDAGDLAGARARHEAALATYRRVGNRLNEGLQLENVAGVLRKQGELPLALERASQAHSVFLELGNGPRRAEALAVLGELRSDTGDLVGGADALEQSAALARGLKDKPRLHGALLALAHARMLQGDLAAARQRFDEAAAQAPSLGKRAAAQVQMFQAELELAARQPALAERAAREATRLFDEAGQRDDVPLIQASLARALFEQGRLPDARAALSGARTLLDASSGALARGALTVIDARLQISEDPARRPQALALLGEALADAQRTGLVADAWEARLALAELQPGRAAVRRSRLQAMAGQARATGFGLYAQRALAAASAR
jgi:serine/threonine protein kinase